MNIESLDQKLWVALACPTSGLEIDARTLSLIDTDKDGRVRASELIAAVKFAGGEPQEPGRPVEGGRRRCRSTRSNDATPEGATLLASARQILANIGKPDATSISHRGRRRSRPHLRRQRLQRRRRDHRDVADRRAGARADPRDHRLHRQRCPIARASRASSGDAIDAFFAEAQAYDAWYATGEASGASVFPLGPERTAAAVAAVSRRRGRRSTTTSAAAGWPRSIRAPCSR